MTHDPNRLRWRKSQFSGANADCVEVAETATGVAIRDSEDPDGPWLNFTRRRFEVFLQGCKAGEFDELT